MSGLFANIIKKSQRLFKRTAKVSAAIGLLLMGVAAAPTAWATTFTETVPNGNGPIPNTYPPVGGTMFVLVGANGNIYYQFVNPSTQFRGFAGTGTPTAFQGIPTFQLGPTQTLNCGSVSCNAYFGGSIAEGYARLTVRDADACPGNFDYQDVSFEVNGLPVSSLSDLAPGSVERTNFAGTSTIGTEDCFRNQGSTETSTGWFDLPGNVLSNILSTGGTTPFITDTDTGASTTRGDNFWFFTDGDDATGTPEVAPGIEIIKTADRTSYTGVGDVINYEFEVTNIGSVQLTNIVVDDSFITGAVTCPQTTLSPGNINGTPPGESMICSGQHIVSQQNIDDDVIFVNTASVTGTPSEGTLGSVSGTLSIPGPTADNSMTLTKTADKTTDVQEGDTITYTYVATNTGNITLDDVAINDVHGGSGTLSAVTPASVSLAPGASQSFTATYVVTQDDFDAGGNILNTATATSTPMRGTITDPTADESIAMGVPTPEAVFSKIASPDAALAEGDTVTYTYSVQNTGNVTLTDTSVTDVHGGTGTLSAITPANVDIPPGATQNFTATYVITQDDFNAGTDIDNTATLSTTPARGTLAPLTADETVSLAAPTPAATLTKTASDDADLTAGQVVTYSYLVTNTGDVALTSVSVADVHLGTGTLSAISPASVDLVPGASETFTATYTITQDDVNAGTPITNTATLSATPVRGSLPAVTADESVAVIAPAPNSSLTKTASKTSDAVAGDVITYSYLFTNTGNVTLNNVSIFDVHNGSGTLSPITPATVSLDPGDDQTFTATYTITQADIDAGTAITNTATANAAPAGGTYTPATAYESVSLAAANPALTMAKTASDTTGVQVGDVITYSYAVENTGNVSMSAVSVSDVHSGAGTLSAITPASVDLAPGDTQTFTATYTVTQADIDAGTDITNTATLNATPASGTYTPVTDDETVALEAADPAMTMAKTASDTTDVQVGDVITYSYAVENTGNVSMSAVSVSDVHSGSGTLSAITPTSVALAPGDTQTFTATYTVTQADIDAGTDITNTATLNATPASGTYAPVTDDETVALEAPAPSLTVAKTASDTADVAVGDVITYTYLVENTGNVSIDNVAVSDVHSGSGTLSAITPASVTLAPGASQTFTATYTVTLADIDAGTDITNTATVDGVPAGGSLTPATDSETVTIEAPTPAATLEKTADVTANLELGDIVTYSYLVTNTGNVTLDTLSISDNHAGSGTLSAITPASVATLAPGASVTFTSTYEVTQADIDASNDITNTASLASTPRRGTLGPVQGTAVVALADPAPALEIEKTADVTSGLTVGQTVTYTYTVRNPGNVTMNDVTVTDVHNGTGALSAITPASVTLAPGATQDFTATYVVTQADVDAGLPITNEATADAAPSAGNFAPVSDTESVTPITAAPEISLTKVADQTTDIAAGDVITYTYTAENTGNVTLADVSISDLHSGSGTLSTITPASVASLPIGQSATFTATYVVTQADIDAGGDITNTAAASATPPSGTYVPATADERVSPEAFDPELELVKTADISTDLSEGDVVTYTYAVTNTGNVTVNNVTISDVHSGTGTLSAISPANVASLAVGGSTSFTATYVITQADIDAGTPITNIATADATPAGGTLNPATDSESVSLEAPAPNAELTKTADVTSDLSVGDIVTYTYSVTNTGNVSLSDISVSDVHSGAGTLSAITPAVVPALAVGASVDFTATYQVTQADIDAGAAITNTATISATPAGGTLASITADESVSPDAPAPELSLAKRALDTGFAAVGDVLAYEFDVENIGNVTISALSVSDDKIATVSCPVTTLAPGAATTCSASYTVSQADLNAGSVTNIASADGTPAGGTLTAPTDTATVDGTQSPMMTLVKTALDTDFAALGDTLDYEYLVTNTGNVEITNIVVTDDKIASVSCPVTSLMPTQTMVCTATYVVTQADLDAGSITNIAQASGTPAGGTLAPAGDTATVDGTQSPALEMVKRALDTDFASVGDVLTYEYDVTNTGNVTLLDPISVSDDKIASVNCPALPAGGLAPSATLTCTGSYSVTQADLDAGEVTNIASATDGTTTSPTDEAIVAATQTPSMTLVKTANETDFTAVGDMLTYDYTVVNTGNVLISDLVVSDDKIPAVTCNVAAVGNGDANLDPGETVVCTGQYAVTQADLDAGSVTNIASADGTPAGGTLTAPEATETVAADQMPLLTLDKASADTRFAAVGDVLSYTYTIVNTGNVLVSDVAVSDDKIATVLCDVAAVGNGDANLDPGETVVCTADYAVTQADLDAGNVLNNATATASPAGGTFTPPTDSVTIAADQQPAMETVKTATNVNFELPGDITTYEYVVTNTGNVTLTDPIVVTDNLISPVNCPALPAGGLAPNAALTCTADYTVTQADLDAGQVTNIASAASGPISSPQTTETIPADQNPALSIVKTALFSDFTATGDIVEYEFAVTNDGNLTLTNDIEVVDDKIGTITCGTANLVPGATQTCRATYTITQADMDAGEIMNQAFAQSGTLVSAPVDVTVGGTRTPSVGFEKRATTADFNSAGDVITYEFDVENTGNVTLTNLSITDDIIAAVSCPQTSLAPAATMVCSASYTVSQADVDAGEVVNNASVGATPPPGLPSVTTADSAVVDSSAAPGLSFEKRAISTDFSEPGDILTYEFDVENTGMITLSNVVVSDALVPSVTCPTATLAPAASMVCSASYVVTQADIDAGDVMNTASVGANLPNGDPVPTVSDTAVVTGVANPELDIFKSALRTSFDTAGDILAYEITVSNIGNVTISNVVVDDPLIPSLSCPTDVLAPNASFVCTGSYTVTQADIDAGQVDNVASADGTPSVGSLDPVSAVRSVTADLNPELTLVKTATTPDFDSVGDTIDYSYEVTNSGNVTLTGTISVSDNKIASVACPVAPSGGLVPGASLTCAATYVVTQADIDAGSVTNIASATDGTTTSPEVDETVNASQMPEMTLVKTATDFTYASPGDLLSYTYDVINSGNITITTAITVTDDLIPSVTCPALPAGGLPPAASLTCTGTYAVTQADIDAGSVTNIARATDGTISSPQDDATVNADQMPSFGFVKTATDINFESPGDITTYEYVVTNDGNTTITAPITVTDNLIPSVNCPALPSGGLLPGGVLTCTATYVVTQSDLDIGSVTNVASASDGTTTSTPDSETIPANGLPALTMRKSSADTSYDAVGDVLSYTFELENTGNLTLTGDTNIIDDKIGTFLCFSGNLAPGQVETCTETYVVTQADIDAGEVTNNAFAENPTTTSPPDAVTINAGQAPELTLLKTALTASYAAVGDTLDYEFVVTNSGNTTVTNPVSVTDSRIPNVMCPPLPTGGLRPAASLTCTGTDTITQADIDAGTVTNTAFATDGTTTSPDETVTVDADRSEGIEIDKVAQSSGFTAVGDVLSYDYILRNTSNFTLTDPITVSDDKIANVICPANPGLVPGATLTCSATYTVTQADIDAGGVTNIASATSGDITSDTDSVEISGSQLPALSIEKSSDNTSIATAGETVVYSYLITNTGNVTFTAPVSVSDDKIADVICPAIPAQGLIPGASLTCSAQYIVLQADIDAGGVTNIASASAELNGETVSSPSDTVTLPAESAPALTVVKTATTASFMIPGDILTYDYVVTNAGNVTLTEPIAISDDKIASVTCPALPAGGIQPGASVTCTAEYAVTQADVDAGQVTNLATASTSFDGSSFTSPEVSETVEANVEPRLEITKTTVSSRQLFGPIYEVQYEIGLENIGNVTLTNVTLEDDLAEAFAPASLFGTPVAESADLTVDTEYDGVSLIELLSGTDSLAVGENGTVQLTARLDITNGGPAQGNTAYGQTNQLSTPLPSNDPVVTPDTPGDVNPAPLSLIDTDGDGAPDNFESAAEDRDGDGIPDSEDYDPTGYFYCEENGAIIPGGSISVTGPAGTNSATGLTNNINIVHDGTDGFFQFYVTEPGLYTVTPTYPDGAEPSTTRLAATDPLDVSTRTDNPAILGASEVGSSGVIADFTEETNSPFYLSFDIEAGDPSVFLNNIPLQSCGVPNVGLTKRAIGEVERLDDGRELVTYEFTVENTGQTSITDIILSDDLSTAFGDQSVSVQNIELVSAPEAFTGLPALNFDGFNSLSLSDGEGTLEPGEAFTMRLDVAVITDSAGEFTNTAVVSAVGPLNTGAVDATDSAVVSLAPISDASFLRVTKTANPRTVQIGDPVLYTISVTNESATTLSGVDIVDRLPEGFAYVPGSSAVTNGAETVELEPNVRSRGVLSWSLNQGETAPLDALQPNETVTVTLNLLAGPNVTFGAHENQAFAENTEDGSRSDIATATVDYIPEPSFDCTPVIGRVYDDVNVNGYPDDGEPGLPGVRLVSVNGDIITTDEYGRYHIPCAVIADSENGSNFLLKADTRTLPLGYAPTTENPRVVRATRGKFVKLNFGAGFRTKLRVDFRMSDFNLDGTGIAVTKVAELQSFLAQNQSAERAVLVFHADDGMSVDAAQARLQIALDVVRELSPDTLDDIAMEALWTGTDCSDCGQVSDHHKRPYGTYSHEGGIAGEMFGSIISDEDIKDNGRRNGTDRQVFGVNATGDVLPITRDEIPDRAEDRRWNRNAGLRNGLNNDGEHADEALESDTRHNSASILGRRDRKNEVDQSPAPGRLQRWLGWGNSTSAYVDAMEIETQGDNLDPVKRLNAHMDIVSEEGQRVLKAATYSNYVAFADKLEIRVFDARRSARGEPLFTMPVTGNVATMTLPEGLPYELQYVLRANAADGAFDQTAPKVLYIGDADFDLTRAEWLERASGTFGQNTLETSNVRVRGGSVKVYGRNVPGEAAVVMGERVRVDADGRFVAEQLLPAGQQSITIEAGSQKLVRSVEVKSKDTFYVAQVEATIGERIGSDETFEEGRVAFYVRSRLNDRWTVTATADTGEAGLGDLVSTLDDKDLNQLLRRLDPDRYYPTYGDNSVIEQDAPTSGRIYARIQRDDDYALWGNYQTNFNDTEFARVNRTLYGAKLHWDENAFTTLGDARTEVTAFVAEGGSRQARDELRGTGGSVYYLRHGDISIGSEQLRVETRDSVSGLVIESRRLQYGTDYDLDFIQGRVILTRPLGSTGDDGRLFRDGSQSGNAQVLVADYEFTPVFGANDNGAIYGVRAKRWFGDHVKLGATYNHADDGGLESDLYEMDLTLQYAAGTYIKGEVARSEGVGVETFTSLDGGFSFAAADRGGLTNVDDVAATAYAIEAAVNFAEVSKHDGNAYLYWRKREAGFAGYSEATNQSVEQIGGGLQLAIGKDLTLNARADISDSELIGTNSFAEASVDYAVNEDIDVSAGLSYNDDARGNEGAALAVRASHKLGKDGELYAFGQVGIVGDNSRTTDRIGAGAEVRLSKTFFGGGEVSTGEDGLGVRASLRRQEEDGDEYYLAYDLPLRAQPTGNFGSLNVGARKRYTDALSVFGEERLQFNDRGLNGLTHAYGVDWNPGNWNFGFSGELGKIDNLDREAIALAAGFGDERFKAGFAAEWRQDENVDTNDTRQTWLLRWTSQYQASEELRLQGKFNRAVSSQTENGDLGPLDFNEAEFTEGSIAAAYRPIWDDRFNLLAKYTYLEDLSPTSQRFGGETLNYRQKSEILSVDTAYDISPKWTLGGKYAHRSGSVTSNRESLDFTKSNADLGILRLDYHVTHQWDAHIEGRYLDIGEGTITRLGGQAGIYRHMNDNAKLGFGVTWGGIEEEYLSALEEEDDIGWYLNLVGKF